MKLFDRITGCLALIAAILLVALFLAPVPALAADPDQVWREAVRGVIGSNGLENATVDSEHIVAGAVSNSHVSAGIDAAKLSAGDVSNTEFDYLNGVSSALQTQLNAKLADSAGSVDSDNLADGAVSNAHVSAGIDAAKLSGGDVSNTEFDYLNGVSSALQTQLNAKLADSAGSVDSDNLADGAVSNAHVSAGIDAAKLSGGDVSNTEFDYLDGVSSAIQTQLNGKQATLTANSEPAVSNLTYATETAAAAETNTMTNSPDVNNNDAPKWFSIKDATGDLYVFPAWQIND